MEGGGLCWLFLTNSIWENCQYLLIIWKLWVSNFLYQDIWISFQCIDHHCVRYHHSKWMCCQLWSGTLTYLHALLETSMRIFCWLVLVEFSKCSQNKDIHCMWMELIKTTFTHKIEGEIESDVWDCYYSEHDIVFCGIQTVYIIVTGHY